VESRGPIISVRDPEGRLEGIVLLPPQVTLIRESSFSRVKVCAVEDKQQVSDVDRNPGTTAHTPNSSSYNNTQSTSLAVFSAPVNT
jgi:hypothetical protein